jgi:pimeloyl-ACP methyl ester carboxylesterase
MTYAPIGGQQLYYEVHGGEVHGRAVHGSAVHGGDKPLVLLHGGLLTIGLSFGPLLGPLAADRQVIAVELQGHGRTADTDRPMTIDALAGDVIELLDRLEIGAADLFGFSLGGLVACAAARRAPDRAGRLVVASADPHRPPGRESAPVDDEFLPTQADFELMRDAYRAVAPDPGHFEKFAARVTALVHEVPGWTADELRALRSPTLLIFGDRDFSPLSDVVELYGLLYDARLAVLPGTTHMDVTRRPDELLALIRPFLAGR